MAASILYVTRGGQMRSSETISFDDMSLHFLDDEAVVFDQLHQRVYTANASAAVIWSCFRDKMTASQVTDLLVDELALDRQTAEQYVDAAIRQWKRRDNVNGNEFRPGPVAGPPIPVDVPAHPAAIRQFRLLDSVFKIHFGDRASFLRTNRVLGHLTVEAPEADGPEFHIVPQDHGYAVVEYGQSVLQCDSYRQVAATIKAALVDRALRDSNDFCAIHAGAVRRGDKCLLLPGPSGAGKSTLVAGLVSEGFELLADDTAVLARGSLAIRAVPCGICVKKEAWPTLTVRFPRLKRVPIHDRPDGRVVRYLFPPDRNLAGPELSAPAGWIVFPKFEPGGTTALRPIRSGEAFRRLMPCFVPLGDGLEAAEVERLIGWISAMPCYEMSVSSLTRAVVLLGHLCR